MAQSRPLGPYSRPGPLANIDGRRREAGLLRHIRDELTSHVGGKPSATERALIERAAWLTLHVAQLDASIMAAGAMTEHSSRIYLAWSNSLSRTLRDLGLKAAAAPPQTFDDLVASIQRNSPAAPAQAPATALHAPGDADAPDDDCEPVAPLWEAEQ